MKHMSPEDFKDAEPISLNIKIGQGSHAHNEYHKRHHDTPRESVDDDVFEEKVDEEEEGVLDGEETVNEDINDEEELAIDTAPRWESELVEEIEKVFGPVDVAAYEDSVDVADKYTEEETSVPTEASIFEATEDGAFMISAKVVREYALAYPHGYQAFEKDLKALWVEKIQDPVTVQRSREVKKSDKSRMDVFTQFSHITVAEFNEVAKLPPLELEEYLAEHHIDAEDFENWRLVMEFWEGSDDLAFDEETLFGDVVRGAFIAKLEKDRINAVVEY
jgi:hypothetical protein